MLITQLQTHAQKERERERESALDMVRRCLERLHTVYEDNVVRFPVLAKSAGSAHGVRCFSCLS